MVLDHYMLKLDNGCIAVVVGNTHAASFTIGYLKYCPSSRRTLWCDVSTCYERVVKHYELQEIYGFTPWRAVIPHYGSELPIIPNSRVVRVYSPIERAVELMSRVRDPLEKHALDMISEIERGANTTPGVTGSLLPGIHNIEYSDVDLAVYGLRESADVVEFIAENPDLFQSFRDTHLREWCYRLASVTGLSASDVEKLYRSWRRGSSEVESTQ